MAARGIGAGFDAWAAVLSQTRFVMDCQAVIALRMIRLAGGGEPAAREAVRMITEKMEAYTGAQQDALAAMPRHGLQGAVTAAERRYRRAVSRNRRRLSGG